MLRTGAVIIVLALATPRTSLADGADPAGAPARAEGAIADCPDEGGVVGRRDCPPYGMWGAALEDPYVAIGVGFHVRRLPRPPAPEPRAAARSTSGATIAPTGSDTSYTIAETISIATSRVSFIGFEVEISPNAAQNPAPGARAYAAGAQLLLGLHGGTHRFGVATELAGGIRVVETDLTDNGEQGVLEARAHADLWLTPWFTIGGLAGTSLLERGDWLIGVQLGLHTYSYAGH